jgi:glycosyltransferase involved in cell wall biosynthesis
MKILLVNKFLYRKGGSETVLFDQAGLLLGHGHAVCSLAMEHPRNIPPPWPAAFVSRVELDGPVPPGQALRAAGRVLYSLEARRRLDELIRREKPDLAHLHNIHHQISPSILPVLRRHGLPVVMTLHDLKLACPVYTCLSRGRVCVRCRGGRFHHCILQKCSKDSLGKSVLAAAERTLHRRILRGERRIDLFLSPSRFLAAKLRQMGVPGRFEHLPHFVDTASIRPELEPPATPSMVYFGRLDRIKGLRTLLRAAAGLPWPLTIIGDGEMRPELERAAHAAPAGRIILRPHLEAEELRAAVRSASFAVLPSEWYENFPLSVVESFALGKPVVGARIGGIPELVRDGETGQLFAPGDAASLRSALTGLASDPVRTAGLGRRARRFVEEHLNPEDHYLKLMAIYERLLRGRA